MASWPSVSFFVSYFDLSLNQSGQAQCIFSTKTGLRCRNKWGHETAQALTLRNMINSKSREAIDLKLLQQYILYHCCNRHHRKQMRSAEVFTQLAERWQAEIQRHTQETISVPDHWRKINATDVLVPFLTPRSLNTVMQCNAFQAQEQNPSRAPESCGKNHTPPKPKCSLWHHQSDPSTKITNNYPSLDGCRPQYGPRSCTMSTTNITSQTDCKRLSAHPEFRPHKKNPRATDSVYWKIISPFTKKSREWETGLIYMYNRSSSPGYVKIGWSAVSAASRLKSWSKCGYRPNLLHETRKIPHAKRVELLIHYQLMTMWRREIMCKGYGVSHQEWFDVDEEEAKQVLEDWAEFMEQAEPYDSYGILKPYWCQFVTDLDNNGELVTVKRLLKRHEKNIQHQLEIREVKPAISTNETFERNKQAIKNAVRRRGEDLIAETHTGTNPQASPWNPLSVLSEHDSRLFIESIFKLIDELSWNLRREGRL